MKRIVTLLMVVSMPILLTAQSVSIRHLLRSCDTGKEVTRIHIPPVVMHLACCLTDEHDAKHVLRNISSVYLLVSEDKDFSSQSDFPLRVAKKLRGKNFVEMLTVRDQGDNVTILWREKNRNRKEMVITVDGDEDVVLYLKGKLDLNEILNNGDIKKGHVNLHDITGVSL